MILGVDPGFSGGCAILSMGGEILYAGIMPLVAKVLDFVSMSELIERFQVTHCFLEKAQSFPKQGVVSSFNYGKHFGHLEATVAMLKIPYTLVSPSVWTRDLHQGIDAFLPAKEKSLLAVRRLYPTFDLRKSARCKNPHEGMMDSILIAAYGLRKLKGQCDISPTS